MRLMHSPVSTDSLNHLGYADFAVFLKGVHHQTVAADVVDTLRKEVQAKERMKSVRKSESKQASTRRSQVCCGKSFLFFYNLSSNVIHWTLCNICCCFNKCLKQLEIQTVLTGIFCQ